MVNRTPEMVALTLAHASSSLPLDIVLREKHKPLFVSAIQVRTSATEHISDQELLPFIELSKLFFRTRWQTLVIFLAFNKYSLASYLDYVYSTVDIRNAILTLQARGEFVLS